MSILIGGFLSFYLLSFLCTAPKRPVRDYPCEDKSEGQGDYYEHCRGKPRSRSFKRHNAEVVKGFVEIQARHHYYDRGHGYGYSGIAHIFFQQRSKYARRESPHECRSRGRHGSQICKLQPQGVRQRAYHRRRSRKLYGAVEHDGKAENSAEACREPEKY